jgi:hypothetical protein
MRFRDLAAIVEEQNQMLRELLVLMNEQTELMRRRPLPEGAFDHRFDQLRIPLREGFARHDEWQAETVALLTKVGNK